jgi:phosphoglycerate dehydrogenase-like enzyme
VIIFLIQSMRNSSALANEGAVLITWPDYPAEGSALSGRLNGAGLSMRRAPKLGTRSPQELTELLAEAVGAIVSTDPFDASVFEACSALRVVARVGVGVDSIDLTAASAAGVAITTTRGINEATTAEHAVALMLAAVRRIAEHDAAVRRGEWLRSGIHAPWEMTGLTVGLVGCGQIGKIVARRLSGFDVRVIVADPYQAAPEGIENVSLDELLTAADVISVHTPLNEETRGLISPREFALMRPEVILVNTSRGGVIDHEAMVSALQSGRIRGAALDVYESEPPRDRRLLDLPNVVLTPHTAGISDRAVSEMVCHATESVLKVLSGQVPRGLVNRDILDKEGQMPVLTASRPLT